MSKDTTLPPAITKQVTDVKMLNKEDSGHFSFTEQDIYQSKHAPSEYENAVNGLHYPHGYLESPVDLTLPAKPGYKKVSWTDIVDPSTKIYPRSPAVRRNQPDKLCDLFSPEPVRGR